MDKLTPESLLGYSIGYVLFGYLMVLPFWAVGKVWNRLIPSRQINPWYLPGAFQLFILLCFMINVFSLGKATMEDKIVLLGLVPSIVGCLIASRRYRSPSNQPAPVGS